MLLIVAVFLKKSKLLGDVLNKSVVFIPKIVGSPFFSLKINLFKNRVNPLNKYQEDKKNIALQLHMLTRNN